MRAAVRVAIESVVDAADDKHYDRTRAAGDAHLAHVDCEVCGLIADLNSILQRDRAEVAAGQMDGMQRTGGRGL